MVEIKEFGESQQFLSPPYTISNGRMFLTEQFAKSIPREWHESLDYSETDHSIREIPPAELMDLENLAYLNVLHDAMYTFVIYPVLIPSHLIAQLATTMQEVRSRSMRNTDVEVSLAELVEFLDKHVIEPAKRTLPHCEHFLFRLSTVSLVQPIQTAQQIVRALIQSDRLNELLAHRLPMYGYIRAFMQHVDPDREYRCLVHQGKLSVVLKKNFQRVSPNLLYYVHDENMLSIAMVKKLKSIAGFMNSLLRYSKNNVTEFNCIVDIAEFMDGDWRVMEFNRTIGVFHQPEANQLILREPLSATRFAEVRL